MSSAAIYYGAPASRNQQVSEELKSRGINLLRSSPAEAFPDVDRHVNTLQYQNYFNNLGAAFDAAINDKYIYLKTQVHYFVPTTTFNPPYMRTPTIVWNYGRGVTPDNLSSIRERFHAIETVAKGQPALMATLSPTQVRDLLHDTAPSQITAASTTTINIGAYRMYLRLHKLADLFFRVHQYPLSADGKTQSEYFRDAFLVNQADIEKSMSTFNAGKADEFKCWNFRNADRIKLNMNLSVKDLEKFNYVIKSPSDLTSDNILIFPFVEALARSDDDTVLSTVQRFMMPLLGSNREDAIANFQDLKSQWGVLKPTLWGDELAHIYSAVKLALLTGATVRIITTPNDIYQGFTLVGDGYVLYQWGNEFRPVPNSTFLKEFERTSPHTASFNELMDLILFEDDMERAKEKPLIDTMQKVASALRSKGYNGSHEEKIKLLARNLIFPTDHFLPITAHNVSRILTAMTNNESEELYPLHSLAILERDRKKRLLSAFGATAPTFLIPGGRMVSLQGEFQYTAMVGKEKRAIKTTRMFAQVVPLERAFLDLDKLLVSKVVYTPIGTPLAGRASSFSLIREFSGTGGAAVLGALRNLCGVTMTMETGGGFGKRGRGEEEEAGSSKKLKMDEF